MQNTLRIGASYGLCLRPSTICKFNARLIKPSSFKQRNYLSVRASSDNDIGAAGTAAIALGLVANPIVLWSEYTLKTTGAGLQGDVLGGLEGLSYLVILGVVAWSLQTKLSTGTGLPAGPAGLLGAVEGFSYLSLLAGIIVFGLKALGS